MEVLVNEKVSIYTFVCSIMNILRSKGVTNINIDIFKEILYYFSLLDKYKYLFQNVYFNLKIDETIKVLLMTRFIFMFESNSKIIYIIGDNNTNIISDDKFNNLLNDLTNDYISILNSDYKLSKLKIVDPNIATYKIVNGSNNNLNIRWDLITNGEIKLIYDVESKNYFPDIRNDKIILILDKIEIKKVLLKNATFVIKQGIEDDNIVKNMLYTNCLNEQEFNQICKYFNEKEIDDPKVKRLSL